MSSFSGLYYLKASRIAGYLSAALLVAARAIHQLRL